MRRQRFHPQARHEYVEVIRYLEARRAGYAEKFEAEVEAALRRMHEFPRSAPLLPGFPAEVEARPYPLQTFRYSLMVVFEGDEPVVFAVAHQHRKPGYWKDRVK